MSEKYSEYPGWNQTLLVNKIKVILGMNTQLVFSPRNDSDMRTKSIDRTQIIKSFSILICNKLPPVIDINRK
jgi:hypothetical protein